MKAIESLYDSLSVDQKQLAVVKTLDSAGERLSKNCQECAACCVALSVDKQVGSFRFEKIKDPGEVCPNLEIKEGKFSCKDYENRPDTCRDYDCRYEQYKSKSARFKKRELASAYVLNVISLQKGK